MAGEPQSDVVRSSGANSTKESTLDRFRRMKTSEGPKNVNSQTIPVVQVDDASQIARVSSEYAAKARSAVSALPDEVAFVTVGRDFTIFAVEQERGQIKIANKDDGVVGVTVFGQLDEREVEIKTLNFPKIGSLEVKRSTETKTCPEPIGKSDPDRSYYSCNVVGISNNGQVVALSERETQAGIFNFRDGGVLSWAPASGKPMIRGEYQSKNLDYPDTTYGNAIYPDAISNDGSILATKKEFNPPGTTLKERNGVILLSSSGAEYPILVDGKPAGSGVMFSPKGTIGVVSTVDGKAAILDTGYGKPGAAALLPVPESLTLPTDFPIEALQGAKAQINIYSVTGFGNSSTSNPFELENRNKMFGLGYVFYTTTKGESLSVPQGLSWTLNNQTNQYVFDGLVPPIDNRTYYKPDAIGLPGSAAASLSDPVNGEITLYNGMSTVGPKGLDYQNSAISMFLKGGRRGIELNKFLADIGIHGENFGRAEALLRVNDEMVITLRGDSNLLYVIRTDADTFWRRAKEAAGVQ